MGRGVNGETAENSANSAVFHILPLSISLPFKEEEEERKEEVGKPNDGREEEKTLRWMRLSPSPPGTGRSLQPFILKPLLPPPLPPARVAPKQELVVHYITPILKPLLPPPLPPARPPGPQTGTHYSLLSIKATSG